MSPTTVWWMRVSLWAVVLLIVGCVIAFPGNAQIPTDAAKYKRDLIRNSHVVWGLDAPVSTFAGQIHQESGWHPNAVSPVGASGLAQFMPATATWISGAYDTLGDNQPTNPAWAIRALVEYDKWLYDRVPPARSHCERMAFVLASYNGGLTWVQRDVNLARTKGADPQSWFDYVEKFNGGRSDAAFRENRGYPRRILLDLERRYVKDGWGIKSC